MPAREPPDQAGAQHQLVADDSASAGASFRVEMKNFEVFMDPARRTG